MTNLKIGFIGFGNIAMMLTEGLLNSKAIATNNLFATAKHLDKLEKNCQKYQITAVSTTKELINLVDIIVLAVKPNDFADIKAELVDLPASKFVVSLLSGLDLKEYQSLGSTKLISAVPNVCISTAKGIFIALNEHTLTNEDLKTFTELFGKVGEIYYVEPNVFNIASTIAGCTPAYVAMFCEAISEAAVKFGCDRQVAYQMLSQMLIGTATMLKQGLHPGQIKDLVSSPKGTTIKGVISLEDNNFRSTIIKAITATQE